VARAQRQTPPVDHPQSFDEADDQRLKRAGLDLPRLRIMITEALASSASQQEFELRLVALGLRMRGGDRKDPPIIEAADGSIFLGSLARLTRLRKATLAERLKFDAEYKTPVKADDSPSHLPPAAALREADGTRLEAGGGSGISGSTMDILIELLRQVVGGIEQIHARLERLEARLDDPAVVKAIKTAVHG
jgi:hypothetical protein